MERDYLNIRGYRIDVAEVVSLAHRCDPSLCAGSGSCCAEFDLWIGPEERGRIERFLPAVAEHVPDPPPPTGIDDLAPRIGPETYSLRRGPDGLCLLAYRDERGRVLCALHSAALTEGIAPARVKPEGCTAWPLSISSSEPPIVSVQAGARRFPCNTKRPADAEGLHEGVRDLLRDRFGEDFLRELEAALRQRGAP